MGGDIMGWRVGDRKGRSNENKTYLCDTHHLDGSQLTRLCVSTLHKETSNLITTCPQDNLAQY